MPEIRSVQDIASTYAANIKRTADMIPKGFYTIQASQSNRPELEMLACADTLISTIQLISKAILSDALQINEIADTFSQVDLKQSSNLLKFGDSHDS